MSVLWTFDHGQNPVTLTGSCLFLICQRDPIHQVMAVVQGQLDWWTRQRWTVYVSPHRYELQFRFRARLADASDHTPSRSDPSWSTPHGPNASRVNRQMQAHRSYADGLALVMAGGAGPPGSPNRSHFTSTGTINWTSRNIEDDRAGSGRSLVLGHEIGHPLGLDHTYDDRTGHRRWIRDQRGRGYYTQSLPGWERNIMADTVADRRRGRAPVGLGTHLFAPGRIWLGHALARNLVRGALDARWTGGLGPHGIPYFLREAGRQARRRPRFGCSWGP